MKKLAAFILLFSPALLSVIGLQLYGSPGLAAGALGILLIPHVDISTQSPGEAMARMGLSYTPTIADPEAGETE